MHHQPPQPAAKDAHDQSAWRAMVARYHQRLHRMVRLRLDRRAAGRVSASDVLQETYIAAAARMAEFAGEQEASLYLWLRRIATHKLNDAHRRHLRAGKRAAGRDLSLEAPQDGLNTTCVALADALAAEQTTPLEAAARAELKQHLHRALEALDPLDREVLALRHFEQLSNVEAARVLGVTTAAASKRYVRALARLGESMSRAGLGRATGGSTGRERRHA